MKPSERRDKILMMLRHSKLALSGRQLSQIFGISRQVIVGDIAALREQGEPVISTPDGYLYRSSAKGASGVFKCYHTNEQTEDELMRIVSLGGSVVDVMVRHRIYGELSAQLSIHTKEDVEKFMDEIRQGKSVPLMNVTSGYHYHTITAKNEQTLEQIEQALRDGGYLVE